MTDTHTIITFSCSHVAQLRLEENTEPTRIPHCSYCINRLPTCKITWTQRCADNTIVNRVVEWMPECGPAPCIICASDRPAMLRRNPLWLIDKDEPEWCIMCGVCYELRYESAKIDVYKRFNICL